MNTIQVDDVAKPIFSWCPSIEDSALEQMKIIARLPFAVHCALMPDAHLGMVNGAPIGAVIATKDTIVPNFCGVDENCGMAAVKTSLTLNDLDIEKRKTIHHAIQRSIPTGFSHNSDARRNEIEQKYAVEIKHIIEKALNNSKILKDEKEIASQLGTLGGG